MANSRIIGEDDIGPIFSDATEDEEKERAREIMRSGGPAFPQNDLTGYGMGPSEIGNGGMSMRDWFAGQALVRMADFPANADAPDAHAENVAMQAYRLANAMLRERDRK